MFTINSSGTVRTALVPTLVAAFAFAGSSLANAETVMTFNGQTLDSTLLDAYIAGRGVIRVKFQTIISKHVASIDVSIICWLTN